MLQVTAKGGVGDFGTGGALSPFGKSWAGSGREPPPLKTPNLPHSRPTSTTSTPRRSDLFGLFAPRIILVPKAGGTRSRRAAEQGSGRLLPLRFPVLVLGSRATPVSGPGWAGRQGRHGCLPAGDCPAGPGLSPATRSHKLGAGGGQGQAKLRLCTSPALSRRAPGAGAVPGSQMMMMMMMMRAGLTSQDVARRQSSCHFSRQY